MSREIAASWNHRLLSSRTQYAHTQVAGILLLFTCNDPEDSDGDERASNLTAAPSIETLQGVLL